MPRPSFLANIRTGILTVPDASRISGISISAMRALVAARTIPIFAIGKSGEPRIPAGPLLKFCKERGLPISTAFAQSARAYESKYINPNDLRQENLTLPLSSPSLNTDPIYATASGPASFIPEEPPVNEMTPYQSAAYAPFPELIPAEPPPESSSSPEPCSPPSPQELSHGNQDGTHRTPDG